MIWKLSFREQYKLCQETGNQFIVRNPMRMLDSILVCVPFKTYCNSGACREKRIAENKAGAAPKEER